MAETDVECCNLGVEIEPRVLELFEFTLFTPPTVLLVDDVPFLLMSSLELWCLRFADDDETELEPRSLKS